MSVCELLSPAGDIKTLKEAVMSGADSIYFGGTLFNARSSAVNFTNEEITEAVDFCHLRGVKVFVTVNTLINDKEIPQMVKYLKFLSETGVDGIIVQDLGVAKIAGQVVPELPIHGSTQMTVIDKEGAMLLQDLGFKRVVVARELSYAEIKEIKEAVEIEIEVFVHGAICVCYSGQCLMSSFIGGRSGNRGNCAQPCRLLYSIENKKGNLLSPKDMGLINHIKELKNAGVDSLKIEGRMKGIDYVKTVVSTYRKYLDNDDKVSKEDYDILDGVFYRGGLTDGYFTGKLNDMFCYNKPDNPYLKQKKAEIKDYERKITVDFDAELKPGEPFSLTAKHNGLCVTVKGELKGEMAINRPLNGERIASQLAKLGGTNFAAGEIKIAVDNNVTVPISEINNVRRMAVEKLNCEIINSHRRQPLKIDLPVLNDVKGEDFNYSVMVSDKEQLKVFSGYEYLYVPLDLYCGEGVAVLPRISYVGLKEKVLIKNCKKVLARNIGQIKMLEGTGIEIYADFTLNTFNSYGALMLNELGVKQITLSTELMFSQIRGIKSSVPLESVIYGYIPLMITKNCLIKSAVGCKNKNGAILTDRTGTDFKIKCTDHCKNEIYNSLPVVLSDKTADIKSCGLSFGRLMFLDESPKKCLEILDCYKKGIMPDCEFTRGKFYKGV